MTFELFKWLTALASLIGVILNIRHDRRCFIIWAFTNAAWAAIDVVHGVYSQAVLQATYCVLAVYGLAKWKRGENK